MTVVALHDCAYCCGSYRNPRITVVESLDIAVGTHVACISVIFVGNSWIVACMQCRNPGIVVAVGSG